VTEGVLGSVEAYLEDRDLEGDEEVLAAVARALASQMDAAVAAGSARGLSACPPLARRLVEVMGIFIGRDAAEAEREARDGDREARQEERRRLARWAENGRRVPP
jgi:hypothetical protein